MATARSRARCVSATGGTNMGAEAEPTQIRLVCVGDDDVATGSHVRKWMETKNGKSADLKRFATTSQKESFLNRELGLKIKKTKKKETADDR